MHNLYIEVRKQNKHSSLPRDIARDMLTRYAHGGIAIVSDRFMLLERSVKMEWLKYVREVKIAEPSKDITYMQSLTFSTASPFKDIQASVSFSNIIEFKLVPPLCHTLYVESKISKEDLYMITAWMPSHAQVIIYK